MSVRDPGDNRVCRARGDLVRRSQRVVRVDLYAARREEDRLWLVGAEDDVGGVLLDVKDLGDLSGRTPREFHVTGGVHVEARAIRDERFGGVAGRDLPPLPVVLVEDDPAVGHALLAPDLHHYLVGESPPAAEVHVRVEAVVRAGGDGLRRTGEG